MVENEKSVSGKKFVILLFLFFIIFTIVGLSCTYFIGRSTGPYFKRKFEESQKESGQTENSEPSRRAPGR